MKNLVTNICILLLFVAVCLGIACVLPLWAMLGAILFLQLAIFLCIGGRR